MAGSELRPLSQYSLLLPPVGVGSVSQYPCGGSSLSRTPTHRRLGKPLPYQLANGTHTHLVTAGTLIDSIMRKKQYYGVLILSFPRLSPCYKVGCVRVTHPCAGRHQDRSLMLPLDLHVLSLPLAFILSQAIF